MNLFDESEYFYIKKPTRPFKLSRPVTGFIRKTGESAEAREFVKTLHAQLLEMMKFVPEYEQAAYAGDTDRMYDAFNNYLAESGGEFGAAERNLLSGIMAGKNSGYYHADGLNFYSGLTDFNPFFLDPELGNEYELYSHAGIPDETWNKINETFDADSRSYYQFILDSSAEDINQMSNEEAFLLLGALFESRTKIYEGMATLFGSANITDDQARIEHLEAWINGVGQTLNRDSKRIFLLYLGAFKSFFSRVQSLMGLGEDNIVSEFDKQKFSTFAAMLQEKVDAYHAELEDLLAAETNPDKQQKIIDKIALLETIKTNWYAPDQDAAGWIFSKGNYLDIEGINNDLVSIYDQLAQLTSAEIKGDSNLHYYISNPDNPSFLGKPFAEIWGVHAFGVLKKFEDDLITGSITVGAMNRTSFKKYMRELEEYEVKIQEERDKKYAEKKVEAKARARKKAEEIKRIKKIEQQLKLSRKRMQSIFKSKIMRRRKKLKNIWKAKFNSKFTSKGLIKKLQQKHIAQLKQRSKNRRVSLQKTLSRKTKIRRQKLAKVTGKTTQSAIQSRTNRKNLEKALRSRKQRKKINEF